MAKHRLALVAVILTLVHAVLLGIEARWDSAGRDEVGHFAAGLSHWQTGNFELYRVNPPLVRLVAALPIRGTAAGDLDRYLSNLGSGTRIEFAVGRAIASGLGEDYFRFLSQARVACIPFSLLGAWVCYQWARRLHGPQAGLLATALWCFCPNILGMGHLITPDVGASAFGVLACYAFWRWLQSPTLAKAQLAGLCFGLAQLTKSTWIILFVLWPILWAACRLARRDLPVPVATFRKECLSMGLILLLGLLTINLGYGFEGSFKPLGSYQFASAALAGKGIHLYKGAPTRNRFAGSLLASVPMPLPSNYVLGIDLQKADFEGKMYSYLRGEWRMGGWWYYYLYAMLIKVPLGVWLLGILAAIATLACHHYRLAWHDELVLLAPAILIFVLVSSQTGFNHHLRYVLPAFPFLFIAISRIARCIDLGHRQTAALAGVGLIWAIVSSISVFPHSLSYFNELVGGPLGGHWHLGNSNIDWGQDLLHLKRRLNARGWNHPLGVGYDMYHISPTLVGITPLSLPPGPGCDATKDWPPSDVGPIPGRYAVSVNLLHSIGHEYDYFLRFQPVDYAGYSIYLYDISPAQANAVRQQLGLPPTPDSPIQRRSP